MCYSARQVGGRIPERKTETMTRHERRAGKAEARSKARSLAVSRAIVPPREGVRPTLQEFLDEWIDKGREVFAEGQVIPPAYIGWLPDNSQIILSAAPFGGKDEQSIFNTRSEDLLRKHGAVMVIRVAEAWASENLSVRASKASDRKEVVLYTAGDEETERTAMLEIIRDWQGGKATLGETEY